MAKIEHTQMDRHGRILIPSNIRNLLQYKQGDKFVIRVMDDELHIVSIDREIKAAQNLFERYNTDHNSAVDAFLESRKIETNNENNKLSSNE